MGLNGGSTVVLSRPRRREGATPSPPRAKRQRLSPPIVDFGIGQNGGADFAPAARFARNLGENFAVGFEYYTDFGRPQDRLPFNEQQHNLYAVVDFKIGRFDVNAGVG